MPLQRLGNSGLLVSRLSFGSWVTFGNQVGAESGNQKGADSAYSLMVAAYKAGVNFFDNAETYAAGASESIMGEVIERGLKEGVWTRGDIVVTTKIFFGVRPGANNKGCSRKHIVEGTQESLARMKLAAVDVLYCHRPDPVTPMEEIVRAMNHCIDRGWAYYWGTSEWSAPQITEACGVADRLGLCRPICEQPEYNIFARTRVEAEYEPLYNTNGMGLTTWSPLACGVLTGKYSGKQLPEGSRLTLPGYKFLLDRKFGDADWQIGAADEVVAIAKGLGCSAAQLSIAWCLKNPRVSTVILGATTLVQLEENLGALAVVPKLTPEVMAALDKVGGGKGVPLYHASFLQSHTVRGTATLSGFVRNF
jgi:voltage-dependent potassium channel beta subunit